MIQAMDNVHLISKSANVTSPQKKIQPRALFLRLVIFFRELRRALLTPPDRSDDEYNNWQSLEHRIAWHESRINRWYH